METEEQMETEQEVDQEVIYIDPPKPVPNEKGEPRFGLQIDRDYVVFQWKAGEYCYAKITIKNNNFYEPHSYKTYSPDDGGLCEVRRNGRGFLLPGETTTIILSLWDTEMPEQNEKHFVLKHMRCTMSQCRERGALREIWSGNPTGDGVIKIPIAAESETVKIQGVQAIRTLVGVPRPKTYFDPPIAIPNLPYEPPFGLKTDVDYMIFHWHRDEKVVADFTIENTLAEIQAYRVVNPERDVFEFKKNEMGFVSPGKQATVQITLSSEELPAPNEYYFVLKHRACTPDEARAVVNMNDAKDFWRRNDPHGVKKIPVVCESNHVWLRALPEGLNPGATN